MKFICSRFKTHEKFDNPQMFLCFYIKLIKFILYFHTLYEYSIYIFILVINKITLKMLCKYTYSVDRKKKALINLIISI